MKPKKLLKLSLPLLFLALTTLQIQQGLRGDDKNYTSLTDDQYNSQLRDQKKNRLREGASINEVGKFDFLGDRLSFMSESSGREMKLLENRMMERVVLAQENATGELIWEVSGTVTEYKGRNFLLLTRVRLKGKRSNMPL